MEIECGKCGEKRIGRIWNLRKRGWLILFLPKGIKITRCPKCKPNTGDKWSWDKLNKRKLSKELKISIDEEIYNKIQRVQIARALGEKKR